MDYIKEETDFVVLKMEQEEIEPFSSVSSSYQKEKDDYVMEKEVLKTSVDGIFL
jgi:hypothetical protein